MIEIFGQKANDWFEPIKKGLDRGHLVPKGDFVLTSQKVATFSYLNAKPQFATFNSGNWLLLERSIRKGLSGTRTIYTGVRGIRDLPLDWDPEGRLRKQLHLEFRSASVDVPQYFWKVVVPENGQKLAFIGLNFPEGEENDVELIDFCNLRCDNWRFSWLQESLREHPTPSGKGTLYCCIYDDTFITRSGIDLKGY